MKRNRIISYLLMASVALFTFQSCLFEEKDLFEKSASERLQDVLDNTHQILQTPENGWLMYYFPDDDQTYGGFSYILKFTDKEATAWGQLFSGSDTALYTMKSDNGPTLSFDTFNYVFHYFATPSGTGKNIYGDTGHYLAYRGDFEFLILSATKEEIRLKGKRSGCICVMVPFSGTDPEAYMDAVNDMQEAIFVSSFDGTIGGENAHIFLDLSNIQAEISLTDEKYQNDAPVNIAYMYTDQGIRFYQPVEIGGYTIEELKWEGETQKLVNFAGEDNVDLVGKLPDGWHAYDDFIGDWTLYYNNTTLSGISIKEEVKGRSYLMSGLSEQFDVRITYNLGTGVASWLSQIVGTDENNYSIRMASWSPAGYVNYSNANGLFMTFGPNDDGVDDATVINLSDNKNWGTYTVGGFYLYRMSGSTRIGAALAPWLFRTGNNQLRNTTKLTRVN